MKKSLLAFIFLCISAVYAKDCNLELVNRKYFGTVAKAFVNDDVNIRLTPSVSAMEAGKLYKGDKIVIKGFSDKRETIDNFNGYWLKIEIPDNAQVREYAGDNFGGFGYVFSKYVDIDPALEVSKFKVVKFNPETKTKVQTLELEIDRNGDKSRVKVIPSKFNNQKAYYFPWSDDMKDFMYCDPAGTFKWDPDTGEIKRASYLGYEGESAWCIVSDDGKYFFQDYGTCPGVRGFAVYDNKTCKKIISGSYLDSLEFDGSSIVAVDYCSWWYIDRVSEESVKRAEEYKKTLTEEDLRSKSIVVRYRVDLQTLSRSYLDCTTVYEQ